MRLKCPGEKESEGLTQRAITQVRPREGVSQWVLVSALFEVRPGGSNAFPDSYL